MKLVISLITACWCVANVSGGEDCIGLDELGSVDTGGWVSSVEVLGGYAFVTRSSGGGMDVIDVSDPFAPVVVGSYITEFPAQKVVIDSGVAYVHTHDQDGRKRYLHIVDISVPEIPTMVTRHPVLYSVTDFDIEGGYAFCPAGAFGLLIYDLQSGVWIASYFSDRFDVAFHDVRLVGEIAYLGTPNVGTELVDMSNPFEPMYLGSADFNCEPVVVGTTLYGIDPYGFRVCAADVSDPSAPVGLGGVETTYGVPTKLVVKGETVFVSIEGGGLTEAYDFSDPSAPVLIGSSDVSGFVADLSGDYLYAAGQLEGLKILDVRDECAGVCAADLTGEGDLNFLDVSAFLAAYGIGDLVADFSSDGMLNFLDVSAFLSEFSGGCP